MRTNVVALGAVALARCVTADDAPEIATAEAAVCVISSRASSCETVSTTTATA